MPRNKYTIDNFIFDIPAGEVNAYIPIKIRPAGLSPDSSYFIALKVDSYTAYEVNPEKDFVFYQVRIKNWWASYGGSIYNQRGEYLEMGSSLNPTEIFGTKRVYPLTSNTVRLLAGNEQNDKSDIEVFKRYSMEITIGDDNNLILRPYGNLVMAQINGDPKYSNVVELEVTRFSTWKKFWLHYSYAASDGKTYIIKEELRLEYRDDPDDPRFL